MKKRIHRIVGKLLYRLTALRNQAWEQALRKDLGSIDATTVLEYPLKITNAERVYIGRGTRVSWCGWIFAMTEYFEQRFTPEIHIGDDCYIGNHVHIVATKRIVIGKNVMLADRVYLSDNLHDYRNVDSSIMKSDQICCGEVHIGEDSWIGENVCIVGNVRVGRHCVVGSNAVLNRSLPPFSVAVGVPARIIKRYNFSSEEWEPTAPDGNFLDGADPEAISSGNSGVVFERQMGVSD